MSEQAPATRIPQFLHCGDGHEIAYHKTPAEASMSGAPGVIFLTGFASDMTGGKAVRLESWCAERGRAFLRFDYRGHGASSGSFTDGTIGQWAEDAVTALDALTEGPQVLVGSSMGGWIMLLAALARPERVAGLLGIACAADFTENLVLGHLNQAQREVLERDGSIEIPDYDAPRPYVITRRLLDEARQHLVLRRGELPLDCPVRLIHGQKDLDVPWETSLHVADRLRSVDVEVTLVKNGGHRLSEPSDLDRMCRALETLI